MSQKPQKYELIQKPVTAIKWRGWTGNVKIKELTEHPIYPQMATIDRDKMLNGEYFVEVWPDHWVITHENGKFSVLSDTNFKTKYRKTKK